MSQIQTAETISFACHAPSLDLVVAIPAGVLDLSGAQTLAGDTVLDDFLLPTVVHRLGHGGPDRFERRACASDVRGPATIMVTPPARTM